MNRISYVISGALILTIIFVFFSCDTKTKQEQMVEESGLLVDSTGVRLPIAYINVDSLLVNYEFAKVSGDKIQKKFQNSNNTVIQKQKQLENEYAEFNKKRQKNAFLSQESYDQEVRRIQKLEEDLQQMGQRMQNELAIEEQKIQAEISDSVRVCLEAYNTTAKYHIIMSNHGMDNILIAKEQYNITNEILELLNSRYNASKTK